MMLGLQQEWRPGWRRKAAVLATSALLCLFLAMPGIVRADGPLEVLQVGWDGTVVSGSWSPVRVRVTGGDADVNARVEVILKARQQFGPQATPVAYPIAGYGQEIALPAGVPKEVTVWVPADSNTPGTVRLTAAGRVLAEAPLEFRGARTPFWPLIGVLGESPLVARKIAETELLFQGLPIPVSAARLTAADIPPVAERLDALSALVIQGNAAATLTGEQRQALREWIAMGGHLVLAGGPDAPRAAAALPPDALPVTFTGVESATDLTKLADWAGVKQTALSAGPAAHFQTSAGSVLVGTPDQPLVWRMGLGEGTITVLAVDPALQPLAGWSGTSALLRKALEPALPDPNENEKLAYMRMQRQQPLYLDSVVEALPPEAFPDWRTVALILGGFAMVAGPLTHLLLWRVDRRGWSWLTVPALAIVLSGSMYYVGVGREGRDVLANVVTHVRLDPEVGQAKQTVTAGFFAPTHADLTVSVPGETTVRANGRWEGLMPGPSGIPQPSLGEPPFKVISGRDTHVEFGSGQWTMRTVAFTRILGEEVGSITAQLGLDGGLIKGTVRNDTPYPLEDAAVVVGESLAKLGNLAPGQTAQVVLDPVPPPYLPKYGGMPLSLRLFGRPPEGDSSGTAGVNGGVVAVSAAPPVPARAVQSYAVGAATIAYPGSPPLPPIAWERLEIPQDPEILRRVRLLDSGLSTFIRPRFGPGDQAMMPLTFIAFTRAQIGADLPSAGNHPTYSLTLVEQPLHLELTPGPFTLPPALIPSEIVAQTSRGMGGGSNGVVSWIELHGGSVTYSFHPPLPQDATVEALIVATQQIGRVAPVGQGSPPPPIGPNTTAQPAENGVFTVYNWQSGTWEALTGGTDETRLAPGAPYISGDGQVKIQISAPTDHVVRFIAPDLTVEGVME